jgi:hypothetical protein
MAFFETPDMPQTRVSPQLLVGAASPLWSYFGAAAAGGVAFWWMTRWTQPVNLEALLGPAQASLEPAAPDTADLEAVSETAEMVAVTIAEPVIEAIAEPIAEAEPAEAIPDADPEAPLPAEAVATEATVEAAAEAPPASAAEAIEDTAAVVATEPAPKGRARKPAPGDDKA